MLVGFVFLFFFFPFSLQWKRKSLENYCYFHLYFQKWLVEKYLWVFACVHVIVGKQVSLQSFLLILAVVQSHLQNIFHGRCECKIERNRRIKKKI